MILGLGITTEQIVQYINLGLIAIMFLFALIGFARGTIKSTYYMIATLIIFVGGWFLSGVFYNILAEFDFSRFNLSFPIGENDYQLTTINELLTKAITENVITSTSITVEETYTYALISGIIYMVVRFVYFILIVILSFTVFKFIFDIIWLIIRPKKRNAKGKRIKPGFLSRLGGAGIGAIKGLLYSLLIFFLVAGIVSVAESYETAIKSSDTTETYNIVLVEDTATLMSIDTKVAAENPLGEYQEIIDMVLGYRTSLPGTIFGTIKIDGACLDEYIFDQFFSIDVEQDDFKASIKFRKELQKVATALSKMPGLLDGNFNLDTVKTMDKTTLQSIINELSSLDVIKVVIPVGVEIALLSDYIIKTITDEDLKELVSGIDVDALKNIDYGTEFKNLGYAFIDVLSLLEFDEENNIGMGDLLSLDSATVDSIFTSIGKLEIIDQIGKIGVSYVLSLESVKTSLEETGISIDDLKLDEITDWSDEITKIGKIYSSFSALGLTMDDISALDFSNVEISKIDALTEAIFNSTIIKNAIPVIADLGLKQLPEDYASLITIPEDVNWNDELNPLIKAACVLLKSGIISEGSDPIEKLKTMSDDTIDELAECLSKSGIIVNNLNGIINKFLGPTEEKPDGMLGITISGLDTNEDWDKEEIGSIFKAIKVIIDAGIIDSEDYVASLGALTNEKIDALALNLSNSKFIKKNLSSILSNILGKIELTSEGFTITVLTEDEWTQTELSSIFKAMKNIVSSGIIGSEDYLESVSSLSEETISELTLNLSSSKFIKKNLGGILEYLLNSLSEETDLDLVVLEEDEWTQIELKSIFMALKEIAGSGIMGAEGTDGIKNLTDTQIDRLGTYISQSAFFTRNLTPIMDMLLGNMDLGNNIEIKGFEDSEDWTKVEIVSLLKGARIVVSYTDDLTKLVNLSEDDLDTLLNSTLITDVLVDFINEYSKEGNTLEIIEGTELINENEWKDNYTENVSFTINSSGVLTVTPVDDEISKYYIYVLNTDDVWEKLTSIEGTTVDLNTLITTTPAPLGRGKAIITTIPTADKVKVEAVSYGEIREMFLAVQTICGDTESGINTDAILANLTSLTEENIVQILKSKIVSETLISQIEKYATAEGEENPLITIPSGELTALNPDETKNRTAWLEQSDETHGELFYALRAITIVFDGMDMSGDITFSTDLVTKLTESNITKILSSKVISETITVLIEDMASETENTVIYIPSELLDGNKIDRVKWNEAKEIENLLIALTQVFNGGEVNTDNLKIKSIIDSKDKILKSLVICETIRKQLVGIEGISIPTDELSDTTLTGWKNTYDSYGNVTNRGEIDALLKAIEIVLSINEETTINNISTDSINLYNVINQRANVLKSLVLTNTIKTKLTEINGINVPENEGLSTSTLAGWKNTYNSNGTVKTTGEIDALLNAINIVLNITSETTINNISTDSIKLKNVIDDRDEVLKSLVLTNTIKTKLTETDGIDVPTEELSTLTLDGWKNEYNSNGTVKTTGEIDALLKAIEIVLNITSETTIDSINTNSIKLKNVIDERDQVLKSLVLTNTIKTKLTETDGIDVPTEELSTSTLEGWKNTYTSSGIVDETGEIDALLNAIGIVLNITEATTIDTINTDSIKLKNVIDEREDVLKSLVLTNTIKTKLLEVDGINVPTEELSTSTLEGWKNTYTSDGLVDETGEIDVLLNAIGIVLSITEATTINTISTDSIKLKNVIDEREDVLKSLVLTNTIKTKLIETDGIDVPTEELSTSTLIGWKNTYNSNGTLATTGEIDALLNAIGIILSVDEDTTINNINTDTIKLYNVIESKNSVLKSLVITDTIKSKLNSIDGIDIPSGEGLSETSLVGWKNTYTAAGIVETTGEIDALLNSINIILNIDEDTTISSIDTNNIKLKQVIDYRENILKSILITNTIKTKLNDVDGIDIPANEGLSETSLTGWKNTYSLNGELVSTGEIDALLNSIGIVLSIDDNTTITSINTNNIKLKNVIDDRAVILKSVVITNTIKQKLNTVDGIETPSGEGLSTTDLTGWKNTYTISGSVSTTGEIDALLNAISIVLSIDDNTTITSINTNDIKLKNVIDEREEILKSILITNTIKIKLNEIDGIDTPINEELSTTNLAGWKNIYSPNGSLSSTGEIDALLNSIGIILNVTETTTIGGSNGIDTDDIKLKSVIDNRNIILKSLLITNTIKTKIVTIENSGIDIPTNEGLSTTDLTGWKNIYSGGTVTTTGELSYLLNSLGLILNPAADDGITEIDINNITIGNIVDNKDMILHSKVLSETIMKQIMAQSSADSTKILRLPANYNLASSNNYISWKNTYTGEEVNPTSRGEIDAILGAIGELLSNTNVGFGEISSFNYSAIFNDASQVKIFKSKLISETIICQLESNDGLKVPNDSTIKLGATYKNDRSPWWNTSTGELNALLDGIGSLLTPAQKQNLSNIDIDVDNVYSTLVNEESRIKLLSSYIIAETLTVNFSNLSILSIPTAENSGVDFNELHADGTKNRDAWYKINIETNTRSIEEKEIWNLIESIHILLGDSFNSENDFTIDQLLENDKFIPTLDANKFNTNNTVGELLVSKLMEEIFVGLVQDIFTGTGPMASYINSPSDGYNWYKFLCSSDDEYDTRTIIESLYQMQDSGLGYNSLSSFGLSTFSSLDIAGLSDAFVISRSFRGSIGLLFNKLLNDDTNIYNIAYMGKLYAGSPIPSWDDAKLVQSDYNEPKTRVEASTLLYSKLNTIINNIIS